jgi:hypothetical protein
MQRINIMVAGANCSGKDKFIDYVTEKQLNVDNSNVMLHVQNTKDRLHAIILLTDLSNEFSLYHLAENLNKMEDKFSSNVVIVVVDLNLAQDERYIDEKFLRKFLFENYINGQMSYPNPILMKILNIDKCVNVDRFLFNLVKAALSYEDAVSLQLSSKDLTAATQSEKFKLCNLINEVCSQTRFWHEKVVFKGISGGLVVPGGIKQILDIDKQNLDLNTKLPQMKNISSFKYSFFFQWAHEAFRGRHPATNKFYGIIDDINLEDSASVDTGVRRLEKFYNKYIYPSGQELLALGRK